MEMLSGEPSMVISESGAESLEGFFLEFGEFIKTKLYSREPADIEPLKVRLNPQAIQILAKKCCYSAPKREFMKSYVRELIKQELMKKTTDPKWVSASLIVSKNTPELYRLTLDYHLVNSTTITTF